MNRHATAAPIAFSRERLRQSSIAASLVIGMHALLFAPLLWGTRDGPGQARNGQVSRDERVPRSPLTLVRLPQGAVLQPHLELIGVGPSGTDGIVDEVASRRRRELFAQLTATPPEEISPPPPPATSIPPAVQRIGEITAHLQAAWMIPARSAAVDFRCRVHIRQGATGTPADVEVRHCDDDPLLRSSLMAAVREAMPMFSNDDSRPSGWDLTLEFMALATPTTARRTSVQPSAETD